MEERTLLPWSPLDKGTSLSQHHSVNFTKGKLEGKLFAPLLVPGQRLGSTPSASAARGVLYSFRVSTQASVLTENSANKMKQRWGFY